MSQATDVLVAGSGIGGLSAALRAARAGARVLVAEKASDPGGTTVLSGGRVWGMKNFADVRSFIPHGDTEIQRSWVEAIPRAHAWLDELNTSVEQTSAQSATVAPAFACGPITNPIIEGYPTQGRTMDAAEFVEFAIEELTRRGALVLLDAAVVRLMKGQDGRIAAATLNQSDTEVVVTAKAVILATGGFAANSDLVAKHITPHAGSLWLRCADSVSGDGLRLALEIGAAPSDGAFDSFYGHNLPARPARFNKTQLLDVTQYYGPAAIAINLRGERFTDEGETHLEATIAQDTATQPEATALLAFDEVMWRTYRDPQSGFQAAGKDKYGIARDVGAPVLLAHDLDDLVRQAGELGIAAERMRATVDEFNVAAANGTTARLGIPKSRYVYPLTTPPFYGVLVQPGITGTMGGLKVDRYGRVLDISGNPIVGLYASGVDIGNLNNRHYAGMLSTGLVFGMIAADHAVNSLVSDRTR